MKWPSLRRPLTIALMAASCATGASLSVSSEPVEAAIYRETDYRSNYGRLTIVGYHSYKYISGDVESSPSINGVCAKAYTRDGGNKTSPQSDCGSGIFSRSLPELRGAIV